MAFELNPVVDLSDAVKIRLGGREFFIAHLYLRQTSRIGPLMPKLLRIINRRAAAQDGLKPIGVGAKGQSVYSLEDTATFLERVSFTVEEMEAAVQAISIGLSRAYPGVRADDLYEMPVTIMEVSDALSAVMVQTRAAQSADGSAQTGEA